MTNGNNKYNKINNEDNVIDDGNDNGKSETSSSKSITCISFKSAKILTPIVLFKYYNNVTKQLR